MKRILIFTVLVFCFNFSIAQKSTNAYNNDLSKENNELLEKILKIEEEREARILNYLEANPKVKRYNRKGNFGIVAIRDIIDGTPIYRSTDNLDAARATGVIELQIGGSLGLDLDGAGMTVGVWDGGPVENDHPEFMNLSNTESRVTNIDNIVVDGDTGFSNHGTHVSCTISGKGVDPSAMGMAPNVDVKSYNWNNDNSEMIQAANDVTTPIILSNHSYGVPLNIGDNPTPVWLMGAYSEGAATVDAILYNNPYYLSVWSAGNSGSISYSGGLLDGFDKLTTEKNSKNNLVVANASPTLAPFTNELTSLVINSGSSQGPTDDLRIKPDIAADGTQLYSAVSGGGYATFSGTSMSAPNTTGALILLQQYYEQLNSVYMKSASLRGLVCHTAIDDDASEGPDPRFGWGFLNAIDAANAITDADSGSAVIEELTLDQGQQYTYTFSAVAGDLMKASICWTDIAGPSVNNDLNNQTPRLVNDLDLRITKDGVDYEPWMLDFSSGSDFVAIKGDNVRDNIEVVEIDNFETGNYTITVSHKGTLQGNSGGPFDPQSQDFSLILTGNNLTLGVNDNAFSNSLVVYPNPNKGEFTISFDTNLNNNDDVKVDVYDISGRLVFKETFVNESVQFNKTINLNGVASGVYLTNISKGTNFVTHKIIIE